MTRVGKLMSIRVPTGEYLFVNCIYQGANGHLAGTVASEPPNSTYRQFDLVRYTEADILNVYDY